MSPRRQIVLTYSLLSRLIADDVSLPPVFRGKFIIWNNRTEIIPRRNRWQTIDRGSVKVRRSSDEIPPFPCPPPPDDFVLVGAAAAADYFCDVCAPMTQNRAPSGCKLSGPRGNKGSAEAKRSLNGFIIILGKYLFRIAQETIDRRDL